MTAPNYRNPHGTTKPCCVRPLAVGAVEPIRQLALFGKLLDYLDKLFAKTYRIALRHEHNTVEGVGNKD